MPYPVLPYTWTLDGLAFGDGVINRYLTQVRGWQGPPPPKMNKTPRVGADGDWLGGHYLGPRSIDVKGCWRPTSRADSQAAQDAISALCSGGTAETQYVLRRTEVGRDRWTYVVLDDALEPVVERSGLITFETQLYSSDSRWFSAAQQTWGPIGLPSEAPGGVLYNGGTGTSGDGIQWNGGTGTSGDGVVYQSGSGGADGTVIVTNSGDSPASVVITMTATGGTGLTQPFASISGTGETVQYNSTLSPGTAIEIDTGTSGVKVGGVYVPGVLKRAQMFRIPAKSTRTISFGSQLVTDQGLMSGYHYHTYKGG
jgi:hypothetical protein